MVHALTLRMLSLLAAGGLAACSALPRSVVVEQGRATTIALDSRNGPTLTLQNASCKAPAEVYSEGSDTLRKVVPDVEMQALLDVFTAEELFALSVPNVPAGARDVLRLEQGSERWIWARRGSHVDPREAGFVKARAYFLQLYNGSTAYHSAPEPEQVRDNATRGRR